MKTNIEQIEEHLKAGNYIAVSYGSKKLTKPNTTIGKFNYNMEDVLKEAPSVGEFMKSLPSKGFLNGSILHFRAKKAGAIRTILVNGKEGIELTFADQPNFSLAGPSEEKTPTPQPSQPMQNQYTPPAPAPQSQPVGAMGFTQMPIHELVSLQVQKERHHDLQRDLEQARKDRDQAQSELRIAKENEAKLERTLDTIKERNDFALERAEANQKKWHDKIEPNKLIEALPSLAGIITALKTNGAQAQIGMGNPLASLSQQKQDFIEFLKNIEDSYLPLLTQVAYHASQNEEFERHIVETMQTLPQSYDQDGQ